jgi:hypothetical protein
MEFFRITICPKEVQLLTGRSLRHAQRMLREIRIKLKRKDCLVTVYEFCSHYEFKVEEVTKALSKSLTGTE